MSIKHYVKLYVVPFVRSVAVFLREAFRDTKPYTGHLPPGNKNPNCQICGAEFRWYWRQKYYCDYCGKCVCIDCISKSYPKSKNVCMQCFDEMIVVRSGHVGGHTTIKILGDIETDFEYDDFDDAKSELKCKTLEVGGNAILNCKHHRHKYSQPTNGGTYYYNKFSATGTAAIVKERAYGGERGGFSPP